MTDHTTPSGIAWAAVTIDCRNVEAVAGFWSNLLGLPVGSAGPGRPGWRRLGPSVPGGPVINLQPVPENKLDRPDKSALHLDLWVDDLDTALRLVEALGGSSSGDRQPVPGRGTIMVAHDPEGHVLCLISTEGA